MYILFISTRRKDDKYSVDVKPNLYTNTGAVAFYNDKEMVDLDGNEKSIEADPIEECVKVPTPVSVVIPEPQPGMVASNFLVTCVCLNSCKTTFSTYVHKHTFKGVCLLCFSFYIFQ